MTITYQTLTAAQKAMQKLSATNLSVKESVKLARLIKAAEKEFSIFNESYMKLVKKYGTEGEQPGEYTFGGENRAKFEKELSELIEMECTLPCDKVEISSDIEIEPAAVIALEEFVEFDIGEDKPE